jgi:hypothetical protein
MKSIGLALALVVIGIAQVEADSTIDLTNRQAWAANFGYTDWRPSSTDGVNIGVNFCSGFIYAANVGWIKMGAGAPANGVTYSNSSASDFGVNCSAEATGEKNLRGFAYGANIGWVNFETTGNPRVILSTGQLRGYVWSANCGWINLDDANVFVATSLEPSPTATPTATATPTPNPTATATTTPNPTATATPHGTATPIGTATPAPSATPSASPASPSRLANISTRMRVEAGDNVLIAGFIVEGSGNKRVILRAIGPSLAAFGIADPLQDPTLALNDSAGMLIAANDDWAGNPNATEIMASGLAPADPYESALLLSLAPGSYTAVLRGKNVSSGIGLVEVYDLDADSPANIANISTRGLVLIGQNMMIGGFIITGSDPGELVVRAIGPSLGHFGVPTPLADPFLEVHDSNGATIQTNDNWRETQEATLLATGLAPSDDAESAILISVAPGNYTAIVKGSDGGTGNGLVEVYKLSP